MSGFFILDTVWQNALAFLMSSSVPAAMATTRGHCSASWSPLVKQAAQALPVADDPETGGPTFSFGFCVFSGGLNADDKYEIEEEDEDELRWLLLAGVVIRTLPSMLTDFADALPVEAMLPKTVA